ncbi:sigma-54-dependent Fis family transcriptional regulator [Fusibacter paucivorans]|uniref:Sigma-54-dependent Fis family transcriptional regulator n=1 Tax=Fusibacter paucivorans TaxID=76009 RepID=A0ABS5PS89_9FIRM|nr:sigma-54-dependent Fis family transcriptional regulator [Fusibacter paucivorans]MBS7527772.1 sigma-54-dependent Fis family transcriptional regulator [Fusibacter paucivorans]
MPSKKLHQETEKYRKAWEKYVATGLVADPTMRKIIIASWRRSRAYGVDPHSTSLEIELTGERFQQRREAFKPILDIALPFMESIYNAVGESGMIISFSDANGYILERIGADNVFSELQRFRGMNLSEERMGTNAIALALKKGMALQVIGAEHFNVVFHNKTTSAAPIKDIDGNILGVLSVSGTCETVHPHTLGMVLASALAIEHEIRLKQINDDLTIANEHLDAIMQSISEGIITVNDAGVITDSNLHARKVMRRSLDELVGKTLDQVIKNPVFDFITQLSANEEREVQYYANGRKKTLLVSSKPIYAQDKTLKEYLLIFRETKRVYSQVNKLFGSKAIYTFDDILGESKEIQDAIRMAKLVSATDATILLHGESGTGKEMFAQGIHNASQRKNHSFVFINCGAIPRDLVASELFGYVEGAFTSARKGGNPGKFELADGGTLFLDEIGDMPLDTQANLLRVLETKEVVRVGGNEVIPVDVRVIAATHKDLAAEVEKGNFRSDLFYRLNVMPIKTPSLRERREDIKKLINRFYSQFVNRDDQRLLIDESFYLQMMQYDWPGNVRELQNVMQLVTNIVGEGEYLSSKHLPIYVKDALGASSQLPQQISGELTRVSPLSVVERQAILKALDAADNNLAKAAKLLEIGRSTLYRKIEKYDIKL